MTTPNDDYAARAAAEGKAWGDHLQKEAQGTMLAWLDHPAIAGHYEKRGAIDGLNWKYWVRHALGHPAARSLDLGCGSASRSLAVWQAGSSLWLEGTDLSEERIAEGERERQRLGAPGRFWAGDSNRLQLESGRYELIFSAHSFHHFLELEHILAQVEQALAPGGLFILEEFVGPTQFQWTDSQMAVTNAILPLLPESLRILPWGAVKHMEGRPTVEEVVAVSPFESIRSAEIVPLFEKTFDLVLRRNLGGTFQHLLYNGIACNFWPFTEVSERAVRSILQLEDELIDSGRYPSDFQLLVGRRR